MADRQQYAESDPRHHKVKIKDMLDDVINHTREDVSKIDDPRGQAFFETTAEVLGGLKKAYEDYESRDEEAWRG